MEKIAMKKMKMTEAKMEAYRIYLMESEKKSVNH